MSVLEQLKELFPGVAEDFLREYCEAYGDGELVIEHLVDVILSLKVLPEKEGFGQNFCPEEEACALPEDLFETGDDLYQEELVAINFVCDDPVVVDEVLRRSASVEICQPVLAENNCFATSTRELVIDDETEGCQNKLQKAYSFGGKSTSFDVLESEGSSTESCLHFLFKETEDCSQRFEIPLEVSATANLNTEAVENLPKTLTTSKHSADGDSSEEIVSEENVGNDELESVFSLQEIFCENEGFVTSYENKPSGNVSTDVINKNESLVPRPSENCPSALTLNIDTLTNLPSLSRVETDAPETMTPGNSLDVKPNRSQAGACRNVDKPCSSKVKCLPHLCTSSKKSRPTVLSKKRLSVKVYEQQLRKRLLHQCRLSVKNKSDITSLNDTNFSSQFATVESKFSLLTKILPDADAAFLQAQCQNLSSHEDLLVFISQMLDNKDYPKAKESEAAKMMERFQCTVDEFLQAIPDPLAQFSSDIYNRIGYEGNAEIYLQSRYQELSPDVLKTVCGVLQYNLTQVCQELEDEGYQPGPYCLDCISLHHAPSIFFRQEVWYIEHKAEIQNVLDSVIEAARVEEELNRPPTPPPVEEVFECEICSEEVEDYTQLGTCDGAAGHLFCKSCIKRSIEIQFGQTTSFSCLQKCEGHFSLQIIEEVLPAPMFAKLKEQIQEAEVRGANIPGLESCPFCPYAYVPGEDNTFNCLNPSCKKISCRICRKEDHSPEICEMFKEEDEETARHFVENKMTEALVRPCNNCGVPIVKEEGCNMMTCSFNECRAKMCYICREPVVDYTHFNGQGGTNFDRCELFSDDTILHDRPVAASAQQAFSALVTNNPGIKLDRNRIIP